MRTTPTVRSGGDAERHPPGEAQGERSEQAGQHPGHDHPLGHLGGGVDHDQEPQRQQDEGHDEQDRPGADDDDHPLGVHLRNRKVPRMRTSWQQGGEWHTRLRGRQVFGEPRINKGTGFRRRGTGRPRPDRASCPTRCSRSSSRPPGPTPSTRAQPTPLAKNVFLTALHDRNEVLFYRLLTDHLREMLPIVYTPTIGEAIERYSHQYRRPRGVYLSVDAPELIESSLAATDLDPG